ncbi:MAG: hypothetical protein OXB98_01675 [Bryobacterales bacterium]|nr:hypothetical protein [Bryobacterales bacterium]
MTACSTPDCPNQVSRPGHTLCYACWKSSQQKGARPTGKPGLNASKLGEHFNVSSQRMNLTLAELGWIERAVKGWSPTRQGVDLGARAAEFNGRPYVTWPDEVVQNEILANALQADSSRPNGTAPQDDPRQAFAAQYRTADGHYIRSRAELAVDNWLYRLDEAHAPKDPDESLADCSKTLA